MEKIPKEYKFYNFNLTQMESQHKKAFILFYKDKEITSYDGIVPLLDIKKSKINFNLDYYFPMDFLRFCNDYFNFRMIMSNKMCVYDKTKQEFFFDFPIFDEYCSQILAIIKEGIINFDKKINKAYDPTEKLDEHFDKMHQKVFSLIETLYNVQRSYSTNPILNSKIHVVTSYYPDFGLYYDILKNEIMLFEEKGDFLALNKKKRYSAIDLAWYLKSINKTLHEKLIETLFNIKNICQAYENSKYKKKNNRIINELRKFTVL